MKNPWKTLDRKIIYKNKWGYKVRVDKVLTPAKTPGEYLVIENPGYVFVVALTKDKKVLLERSWRYPIEEESLEIPAGHVESEKSPLAAAKKELVEETGTESSRWIYLGRHWLANGVMKIRGHSFLALDIRIKKTPSQEAEERISIEFMDFNKAIDAVMAGKFEDYRTKLGLLLAQEYLRRHKLLES